MMSGRGMSLTACMPERRIRHIGHGMRGVSFRVPSVLNINDKAAVFMKKHLSLLIISMCLTLTVKAQNVWEKPDWEKDNTTEVAENATEEAAEKTTELTEKQKAKLAKKAEKAQKKAEKEKEKAEKAKKPKEDPKYLRGAVPMEDGKVKWTLDVDAPGKSAQEIYDIMLDYMRNLTEQETQLDGSKVALVNKRDHIIITQVREWLVFKDQFLALDRAKFHYTLVATCSDGHLTVTMDRLSYRYEENNGKEKYTYAAEGWITDDAAVNKKNTRLYHGSAKFRRKTIDRKDDLFASIAAALK